MSERLCRELPGSAEPINPDTWRNTEGDEPLIRLALRLGGLDVDSPRFSLAKARPVRLAPASLEFLDENELRMHEREIEVYGE